MYLPNVLKLIRWQLIPEIAYIGQQGDFAAKQSFPNERLERGLCSLSCISWKLFVLCLAMINIASALAGWRGGLER